MAPRSIWNGAIAVGLVQIPIKVYSATESKTVHFHEVHAKDGSRIEHRRICPRDDKEVPHDEIVKGFEVKQGEWVELTDDEIAAAAGPRSKLIDVDHFVPAGEIDPDFYERAYYVGAGDKGGDAYALLHAALAKTGRAAVGKWVFHDRERTVVVRVLDDALALHTLRFAAELIDPAELDLPRVRKKPTDREIKMASALVEGLHVEFKPEDYEDEYRDAVLDVVKAKAEGRNIEAPEPDDGEDADPDLLAALEASVKG
jgi:DNA end-binding protein Ku